MGDNSDRLYHLDGVDHIAAPPIYYEHATAVGYALGREETFGELPDGADAPTVRRYAWVYIIKLLGTQLFGDKSGTRIHIRWLAYVARLEDMGGYS
ncbi:hypothetical protein Ahy_A06g028544 [Arachis hypogaea]|uniref:Aminotransferase-like plant mobile domain-containing protein n=1 Tax=Arachis hypogaea TaxID=3818 RepID=A0A445CRC0_ARAHY|nr:hypothetical protein Ahy_A06g028544 [Arachis hypogaea]